jgi:hypothetical protein
MCFRRQFLRKYNLISLLRVTASLTPSSGSSTPRFKLNKI